MGADAKPAIDAMVVAADLVKVSRDDIVCLYPGDPDHRAAAPPPAGLVTRLAARVGTRPIASA